MLIGRADETLENRGSEHTTGSGAQPNGRPQDMPRILVSLALRPMTRHLGDHRIGGRTAAEQVGIQAQKAEDRKESWVVWIPAIEDQFSEGPQETELIPLDS